jgi:hypothetical protein
MQKLGEALTLFLVRHFCRQVRVSRGCGAVSAMPDLGLCKNTRYGTKIDSTTSTLQRDARICYTCGPVNANASYRFSGPVQVWKPNRLSPQWGIRREGRIGGRSPIVRLAKMNPRSSRKIAERLLEVWNRWVRVIRAFRRVTEDAGTLDMYTTLSRQANIPVTISTPAALRVGLTRHLTYGRLRLGWAGGGAKKRRATSWVAEVLCCSTIRREPLLAPASCAAQLVGRPSLVIVYPHTSCRFRASTYRPGKLARCS